MHLPLYFKSDGLPCLVVGGGNVAARKIERLLALHCSLTVIAPQIVHGIQGEVERGRIEWRQRAYRHGDVDGFRLVICATPIREVNRRVFLDAGRSGIPVNVVDDPELSTVIFGATWQEGPLTISVSTGGSAPFMAAAIRNKVAEVTAGLGSWVEAAARFRAAMRHSIHDPAERDRLYRRFQDLIPAGDLRGMPLTDDSSEWMTWLERTR